ncbi:hypothetical protein V6N11_030738 [Hibiscus sabdariffa]|uniref:F-box domain-containing protein n=2 Tax=Hibiscus sabdariffa TaxID=183260 RepID=A0ABR2B9G9_9ROSI
MSDYIPVEVIVEILKRLPVKSLMRFRLVCKSWNTLISHPSFISTHLQASHSRPPNNTPFLLLMYDKNGRKNYFLHRDNDGFDELNQLRFSPFGYQTLDDYNNAVLGFDLSAEEFFEIKLPQSAIGSNPLNLLVKKYGESSIALLKRDHVNDLEELWVMKEYGVVDSWTKVLTLASRIQIIWWPKVLGFRKNGKVLLQVDDREMASLDLNCLQMELHGVEVATGKISLQGSYVESLVLLDKAVNVHSENDVNHPIYSIDSSRIYRRVQLGELVMWQRGKCIHLFFR